MYCIVFSGRLLDGYDPQVVRKAVATRLSLDARQVERLFSGKRVVLKKGVTEESGRLYLNVLHRLGMDAGIARIPRMAKTVQALATFKVVFWGRTLDGFDRKKVVQAACARLRASPEQVVRMFSTDAKVVIKRGVSSDVGTRYVMELARIGMQVDLEVEIVDDQAQAEIDPAAFTKTSPERSDTLPAGFRRHSDEAFEGLLQTQFELPPLSELIEEIAPAPVAKPQARTPVKESSFGAALTPSPEEQFARARPASTKPVEYVRCAQCGHRQTAVAVMCRVCGSNLTRVSSGLIPMDASAHATPTTVLGNMPASMLRSSVQASMPADVPKRRSAKRRVRVEAPPPDPFAGLRKQAPLLVGGALVLSGVCWFALKALGH
jgi:ribosomal protein L40E